MEHLEEIAERARESFEKTTKVRDRALSQARSLTRHCAQSIRSAHRNERKEASESIEKARLLVEHLREDLKDFPEIYYAGYTQDALKEFAEANIVFALLKNNILPSPEELELDYGVYLKGLAEAVGELRRRVLDILINGYSSEAERLLNNMDDIYSVLVTMDYPDAVTGGLRRLTDIVRSITERTRGDMLISLRNHQLEQSLENVESKLNNFKK